MMKSVADVHTIKFIDFLRTSTNMSININGKNILINIYFLFN